MVSCSNCGGGDIDQDMSRGSAVCTNCGAVVDDQMIVSEVTFAETSTGGQVMGQYVPQSGVNKFGAGAGYGHGYGRESREVTLANGRKRIAEVAAQLHMNTHHVEQAQQYYKLAVTHNFIQGRRTQLVVASCLYIVCRLDKTPHMLLDFSDTLQINVYVLGNAFIKLCHILKLKLPPTDPALYVRRFASKLEFGDKATDVENTALRLVGRMKRDWIQYGRRPAGICGAALLIAARLHGFRRTQGEIINVVRVNNNTLRRRLDEFEETPSGKLTTREFETIDLETEQDPPSFLAARRRRAEELRRALEGPATTLAITGPPTTTASSTTTTSTSTSTAAAAAADDDDDDGDDDVPLEAKDGVTDVTQREFERIAKQPEFQQLNIASLSDAKMTAAAKTTLSLAAIAEAGLKPTSTTVSSGGSSIPAAASAAAAASASASASAPFTGTSTDGPTTTQLAEMLSRIKQQEEEVEGLETHSTSSLSDLDDEDRFIYDQTQAGARTQAWELVNREYLIAMEERERIKAEDNVKGVVRPEKKNRRRRRRNQALAENELPSDLVRKSINQKKSSSKINYAVLEGINTTGGAAATTPKRKSKVVPSMPSAIAKAVAPAATAAATSGSAKATATSKNGTSKVTFAQDEPSTSEEARGKGKKRASETEQQSQPSKKTKAL